MEQQASEAAVVDQLAEQVLARVQQKLSAGGAATAVAGAEKVAADVAGAAHDAEATIEKVPVLNRLKQRIAESPEAHFAEHLKALAEEGYEAVVSNPDADAVLRTAITVIEALVKGA